MECLCGFYHFTWDGPICPQFFRGIEDWFREEYPGQKNCYASTEEVRLLVADSLAELGPVFSWDAWFMVYSQAVVCVKDQKILVEISEFTHDDLKSSPSFRCFFRL